MALLCGACSRAEVPYEHESGGEVRVIDGNPACPGCKIVFRDVVTLGGAEDPSSVWERAAGLGCAVAELGTGEFLLGGVTGGGTIFAYDDQGRFAGTIGRRGEGPGELRGTARILVGAGDTLWVADDGNVRMQVWTVAGEHIRSFHMPAPYRRFARLNNGNFAFQGSVTRTGDPMFHLIGPLGEDIGRFGPSGSKEPDVEMGIVAPRPGRTEAMWAASAWRYAIEEWSSPTTLESTLVRDVDWFPPYPAFPEDVYESVPPPPTLHHVREDDSGRLWVYIFLPDADWRPGIPLSPRPTWHRETFDHLIEVIDPATARLVVRGEHRDRISPMCNSALVYSVVETPAGDLRVQVMEPRIVDATGRPWR